MTLASQAKKKRMAQPPKHQRGNGPGSCASCKVRRIPGVRATMCVGLDPEITLINFAEEPSGSTAEAVVQ